MLTTKEAMIELIEIAECNLLYSFKGIEPDQIYIQASPEFNHIAWIFGHCAVHLHWIIDLTYQNKRTYSEEICHYYRYGTTKADGRRRQSGRTPAEQPLPAAAGM